MQYRTSAVAAIYAKSLRLPSIGGSTLSGKIVNLATNDVERFILSCCMFSFLFWGPAQAIAVLGIGLKIIGPAFIAGYVLLLVIVALQFFLGKSFAFYRSKVSDKEEVHIFNVGLVPYLWPKCNLYRILLFLSLFRSLLSQIAEKP